MDMDLDSVLEQKRKLHMCADDLISVKYRLRCHREALQYIWKSNETIGIQDILERMDRSAQRLVEDMESVGQAMVKACLELMEEEG